ncbi:hypothetical protein LXL04_032546 [Taraxacum kok-saghyz]
MDGKKRKIKKHLVFQSLTERIWKEMKGSGMITPPPNFPSNWTDLERKEQKLGKINQSSKNNKNLAITLEIATLISTKRMDPYALRQQELDSVMGTMTRIPRLTCADGFSEWKFCIESYIKGAHPKVWRCMMRGPNASPKQMSPLVLSLSNFLKTTLMKNGKRWKKTTRL